jgi:hypothetical protein
VTDTCRGTLVVHATPDPECTDPTCHECQEFTHALVIPCDAIDGDCPDCNSAVHNLGVSHVWVVM